MPSQPVSTVVELLQALVRIPSVNPDGSPGTPDTGEQACAEYVGAFLESLGARVELDEVLPGRPNVIGRFPTSGDKPRILLGPHLDTVSVDHMTIDPYGGEIRDGRVYGRGASDTKGTMAAMLWALKELGPRVAELNVEVSFVGFMGEENGQPGSRHFARKHVGEYAFALIGEPTLGDIVYTHKGCTWLELTTTGKAAHGATPDLGVNAVLKMLRALQAVDEGLRADLAVFRDPVLGPATVNIGTCQGGHLTNIVPDACQATLDIRTTPALARHGLDVLLEKHLGPLDVAIRPLVDCQPLAIPTDNPYLKKLQAATGGRLVSAPWFCDAAHLAAEGIPSVAGGPGSIAQAHTEDEWIAIDQLEKGVNFYRAFLEAC